MYESKNKNKSKWLFLFACDKGRRSVRPEAKKKEKKRLSYKSINKPWILWTPDWAAYARNNWQDFVSPTPIPSEVITSPHKKHWEDFVQRRPATVML